MKNNKDLTFEAALAELEKAVAGLEAGELPLDEALKTFEHGVSMARVCREKLDEAEKKVLAVSKNGDEEPFSLEEKGQSEQSE